MCITGASGSDTADDAGASQHGQSAAIQVEESSPALSASQLGPDRWRFPSKSQNPDPDRLDSTTRVWRAKHRSDYPGSRKCWVELVNFSAPTRPLHPKSNGSRPARPTRVLVPWLVQRMSTVASRKAASTPLDKPIAATVRSKTSVQHKEV